MLGVQDMSQARARWGEHETATMWSTPALRLVLAGVADPYTAQLVSDACGEQLVWRPQISENTSTSHQVERAGKTYTGGDSHSYAQQRERVIQPADLRAMPAGRALALPQGREPIRRRPVPRCSRPHRLRLAGAVPCWTRAAVPGALTVGFARSWMRSGV